MSEVHLEAALADLEAGRRVEALDALLRAWRDHRAPAIADAIDSVSADVARALPPLADGTTLNERYVTWIEVCSWARAVDVPRLIFRMHERDAANDIEQQLASFERHHPADPRVAHKLMAMLCGGYRWSSHSVWQVVFRMLHALGDARGHETLVAYLAQHRAPARRQVIAKFFERVDRLVEALAAAPPVLSAREALLVDKIRARAIAYASEPPPAIAATGSPVGAPVEKGEAELLALVWAAPNDPGPRQVYGDFCTERGLPRGEFIALQHHASPTPKMNARMRALQKKHLAEWLGPIEPVVVPRTARFEGGFLAACETRFRTPKQREELGAHPAWSTLREVSTDEPRVARAALRLERLYDITPTVLVKMSKCDPLSIIALGLWIDNWPRDAVREALARTRAFGSVVEVECGAMPNGGAIVPNEFEWLLGTPLGEQLRAFVIKKNPYDGNGVALSAWLDALRPSLERVTFEMAPLVIALRRSGGDAFAIEVTLREAGQGVPMLVRSLRDVGRARVASIELRVECALGPTEQSNVDAAVARVRS